MSGNRWPYRTVKILLAVAAGGIAVAVCFSREQYLQCLAGAFLLFVIAAAIGLDCFWEGRRVVNIRNLLLTSYALFLGVGMLLDAFREDWNFNGTAILLAYGSLFGFLFGFALAAGRKTGTAVARPVFSLSRNQLFGVALLFFVLGFGFLFVEWAMFGRLESYWLPGSADFGSASVLPKAYIHTFTQLTGPGLLVALILLRRGISFGKGCVFSGLILATVIWYFLWGARLNFAWLAVAFLIIWDEVPGRRGSSRSGSKPFLIVSFSLVAILALTFLRAEPSLSSIRPPDTSNLRPAIRDSVDIFYELRRTVEYFPDRKDFLLGYSFYGIVANPVPRAFWPGKPIGVGRLASVLYDHEPGSSLGISLPGELYANFGSAGTLVGMFLFGVLAAVIFRWYERRRGDPCALALYILLTQYMWFEIRGDILDATVPVFYQLAPFVLCIGVLSALNSRLRGCCDRPSLKADLVRSPLVNPRVARIEV